MIEVTVGGEHKIQLEKKKDLTFLNGKLSEYEISKLSETHYKVFSSSKVYDIRVLSVKTKDLVLSINNHVLEVSITDHIGQMLEKLGMNVAPNNSVKEVKAPMPGSILSIAVKLNQEVKAGEPLLVLEAMKMENVIKSPGDGLVDKIHVREKDNVEKNQVMISFKQ